MKPAGHVPNHIAAVTASVLRGARTIRQVQTDCNIASPHTAHRWLREARRLGLVQWDDHHSGTLHPGVEVVAHGRKT